jgi:integrase
MKWQIWVIRFIYNGLHFSFLASLIPVLLLIFHCGRHTFSTTVTLSNGVPIEGVSKMLGHTNIRTTQIYAKITDRKISRDMDALAQKYSKRKQG